MTAVHISDYFLDAMSLFASTWEIERSLPVDGGWASDEEGGEVDDEGSSEGRSSGVGGFEDQSYAGSDAQQAEASVGFFEGMFG